MNVRFGCAAKPVSFSGDKDGNPIEGKGKHKAEDVLKGLMTPEEIEEMRRKAEDGWALDCIQDFYDRRRD